MKNLRDYLLPRITKKYKLKDDIVLEKNYLTSSFDKFLELNNISDIDENVYKYYIQENFSDERGRYYGLYQKYLYESIINSYSASDLMRKIWKLSPNIHISNINYVNNQKITQFSFEVNKEDDLDNIFTDKVISLLHQYNYYVKLREIVKNNKEEHYKIVIEPYKPKDITNKIYNELDGIIYHITSKEIYVKDIKFKEIKPKWKGQKYNNEYRDGRIFFIGNNNINEVKRQLKSIYITSKKFENKTPIILKIDLNKYDKKLRFRIDSSASGYDAYFTEEPIPDYCVTLYDIDMNEIDKNNV